MSNGRPLVSAITICVALGIMVCVTAAVEEEGASAEGNGKPAATRQPVAGPFVIADDSELHDPSFGTVMTCPAHSHGTPDEAYAKLRDVMATWPANKISTLWVCRANQMPTLERFAPLVDRVVVNPFVHTEKAASDDRSLVWAGCDHPFLNTIRDMDGKCSGRQLLAVIHVEGEPAYYKNRRATYEEIKWMVLSAVGGNFKGIVWRGKPREEELQREIARLEQRLLQHGPDLVGAKPVNWAKAATGQPVSALAGQTKLFVVLLSPEYLTVSEQRSQVVMPLENQESRGQVVLSLPPEVDVASAKTLSGKVSNPTRTPEHSTLVDYSFNGGGTMLILELRRRAEPEALREKPEE